MRTRVFFRGIWEGWKSPSLEVGMTYKEDPELNECYDHGVNVGQALRYMLKGK